MKKLLLLFSFLIASIATAQVSPLPDGRSQFSNSSGLLVGGLVYTCVGGSSCPGTPLATYTDYTGGVQNANPVVLDSLGSAPIWLTPSISYKIVVEDAAGVIQFTEDGISVNPSLTSLGFTVKYLNTIRFADQFTGSDAGAKIAAAYADAPATGAYIYYCADATLTTPVGISIASGKSLVLDLCGHTITMNHTSGTGLTLTGVDRTTTVVVKNGTFAYSGSSAITGVLLSNVDYAHMSDLQFRNFGNSSASFAATALLWSEVEDSLMESVTFTNNTTAFVAQFNTNNNKYHAVNWQGNSVALKIKDGSDGNTFDSCLVESNTSPKSVQILSLTADTHGPTISNTEFVNCWLENNGDSTNASRAFYMQADAARTITNVVFRHNLFSPDTFGVNGTVYEFNGAGTLSNYLFEQNYTYTSFAGVYTGTVPKTSIFIQDDGTSTFGMGALTTITDPSMTLGNNIAIFGEKADHSAYYKLMYLDTSNVMQLDASALSINAGGSFTATNAIKSTAGPFVGPVPTASDSAGTTTFNLLTGNVFQTALTANTTAAFTNNQLGLSMTIVVVQNASAAKTFAWPANVHGGMVVSATLSSINVQTFIWSHNGSDAYAVSAGSTAMTGGTP